MEQDTALSITAESSFAKPAPGDEWRGKCLVLAVHDRLGQESLVKYTVAANERPFKRAYFAERSLTEFRKFLASAVYVGRLSK